MRKFSLLALFAWSAIAPQLLAQNDDAERGGTRKSSGKELREDSILTDERHSAVKKSLQRAQVEAAEPLSDPTPAAAPVHTAEKKSTPIFSFLEGRRRPGATFGFTVAKPQQIGVYNHYDYLYGKKNYSPGFYGGYYLGSYFLDFGVVGRTSYYHAEGHPLASRKDLDLPLKGNLTDQAKDKNQKLALTLIPLQVAAEVALSPFTTRWVVLRGWMGYEQLYVQETVDASLPNAGGTNEGGTYANTGWNAGRALGWMVSFSLTGLEARSDNSLRSLGIDRYYLSFYGENVKTQTSKMGNFDRKIYGIAFSFEGLR